MMRRKKGGSEKRPVAPEAAVAMAVAMRSSHQLLRILPPGHQPAKAVASEKLEFTQRSNQNLKNLKSDPCSTDI